MLEPTVLLASRRPELVSWSSAKAGEYLVRNHRTGETFQFAEEEHFLLSRLDGRQTSGEIRHSFQARFGEPLSEDQFDEFVQLAASHQLLQPANAASVGAATAVPPLECAPATADRRPMAKRIASRTLKLASAVLRWPAGILNSAAGRIDALRRTHLDFVPRADDVFIVTYPRSGTTWMQMILYQLTTDGSMEIPHIAEFCPWFEASQRSARGFELRPSPRIFKSHLSWRKIPKGPGKYIYVARDGKDVALSYYHLCCAYNGYEATFDEFFERFLRGKVDHGSWFRHVGDWWAHRDDPNVLFLTYEELTDDLEHCVRRIIDFCGFKVPSERIPGILERCRFSFMKEHEARFDPVLESLWEQGVRLNTFLRNGRVGDGTSELSRPQHERFEKVVHKLLEKSFLDVSRKVRSTQGEIWLRAAPRDLLPNKLNASAFPAPRSAAGKRA
jgi:hypothetical protein